MQQRVINTILFAVAATVVVVGFQNCAKVRDLQTADSASKLGGADGTASGSSSGASGGSVSGASGGSTTGASGGSTTGGGTEGGGSTTGASGGSTTGSSEGGGSTTGGGSETPTTMPALTPREKAYKNCETAKTKAVNVAEFIDIMNYYGNRTIRLQNLGIVSNYTGNLTVVGASEQNTARMLKDSVGNYTFCYMDLTAISGFKSGNVTVVGGDIGSVDGFYGNINVYGGRITGSVKNVTGNIDEEP